LITYKKEIINELSKKISRRLNIYDIWLYGSFKDKFSDIDIIIVYKNNAPKIKFSKIITNRIYDGTIIYIPEKYKYNIFLFENLKIYSIKKKKYVSDKLSKKLRHLRELTSFLERYYERREKLKFIFKEKPGDQIRFLKSIVLSYETFYKYCSYKKIKIKKTFSLKKYENFREKIVKNSDTKNIKKFIEKIKHFDKKFCKISVNIIDKLYKRNTVNFKFTFNSYTKFNYKKKRNNNFPYILGEIYNFYALQNNLLSKKIKNDFFPPKKIYELDLDFQKYLYKKIIFLNQSFIDLKKKNHSKGMYRMTWYLKT
jgi:hypothetical protein